MTIDLPRSTTVPSIDSTNSSACSAGLSAGEPRGLVLRADLQTAGRGRRGRELGCRPRAISMSRCCCGPTACRREAATLGFVAAVALGRVLRDLTPAEVLHKWPNDLLVNGAQDERHPAGSRRQSPDGKARLAGAGHGRQSAPPSRRERLIRPPIWSPRADPRSDAGRACWTCCSAAFAPALRCLGAGRFPGDPRRLAGLCRGHRPKPCVARLEREEIAGSFADIDTDGALIMAAADSGQQRRIAAGDVFFPQRQMRAGTAEKAHAARDQRQQHQREVRGL